MRIFMGLFILLIGILLLFGVFSTSIWFDVVNNFLAAWPLIFVFIGISILSGIGKLHWLKYVNAILIILFTLYLVFGSGLNIGASTKSYEISHLLNPDTEVVKLNIDFPELLLDIEYTDDSGEITGTYESRIDDLELTGTDKSLSLSSRNKFNVIMFGTNRKLTLNLPRKYTYRIVSSSAVFRINDDFIENRIQSIDVNCAVAQLDMEFESLGVPLTLDVDSAIINAKLKVPSGSSYSGSFDSAIKNLDADIPKSNENPSLILDFDSAIMNTKLSVK